MASEQEWAAQVEEKYLQAEEQKEERNYQHRPLYVAFSSIEIY